MVELTPLCLPLSWGQQRSRHWSGRVEVQVSALLLMRLACGAWPGPVAVIWLPNTAAPSLYFQNRGGIGAGGRSSTEGRGGQSLCCDFSHLLAHPFKPAYVKLKNWSSFWEGQVGWALTFSIQGHPMEYPMEPGQIMSAGQAVPERG